MFKRKIQELGNKEWLQEKYINERLSTVRIAEILSCRATSVNMALKRNEIEIRSGKESAIDRKRKGFKAKELNDKEWLYKKYIEEKLGSYEIARLIGTNQKSVMSALNFHNIPTRNSSEAKIESNIKNPPQTSFPKLEDKEWLEDQYFNKKQSTTKIGEDIGCSPSLVSTTLNKFGFTLRTNSEAREFVDIDSKYDLLNNEEWLRKKYIEEQLSTREITKLAGAKTPNSARQALMKFDIEVRNISDGLTIGRESDCFNLNERSLQVLNGSLLGDAGMRCYNKTSEISNPHFYKKNKFKDHVELIAKELFGGIENVDIKEDKNKCRGKIFTYYAIRSLSYKELKPIYDKWYPESNGYKKLVPRDLELTPLILLHWFMDDGCSYRRKRKYHDNGKKKWKSGKNPRIKQNQIRITFCSESFYKEDQEFLAKQMKDKFGLNAGLKKDKGGTGWRIEIPQSQAQKFFEVIGPCPVPSLAYKWKVE